MGRNVSLYDAKKPDARVDLGASDWRCQQAVYMGDGKWMFHNGKEYEVLDLRTQEQKDYDEALEYVERFLKGECE